MASINQVMILGNVGKDPEIRTLQNGSKCANFSVATTEPGYKTKDGRDIPEKTDWHSVTAWRGLADVAEKFIKKGSMVCIIGKIHYRSYDDQNGVKRYATEIEAEKLQLLDKKPAATTSTASPVPPMQNAVEMLQNGLGAQPASSEVDSQLPF